ncbi:MAG: cytosolic protein [Chloroflexi bacterium]|nr:MAG: cytosolic protein [Chloroflexota bacterium]
MKPLNLNDVVAFVEVNVGDFHKRRADSLAKLQLVKILKRKNPYLFKAKNVTTAHDFVKNLLDAHLSSQEEAIFGEFLEQLAIFVNAKVYGGRKSTAEGIDLEFSCDGIEYIVAIKSGPNWGNSSQIKKMKESFSKAIRIKKTGNRGVNIQSINGCCYGIDNHPEKDGYTKLCGQRFWEFISGNQDLYVQIIEPLGHKAKEKNEEFLVEYGRIINVFEAEFLHNYCPDGRINWEKLVRLNSGTD